MPVQVYCRQASEGVHPPISLTQQAQLTPACAGSVPSRQPYSSRWMALYFPRTTTCCVGIDCSIRCRKPANCEPPIDSTAQHPRAMTRVQSPNTSNSNARMSRALAHWLPAQPCSKQEDCNCSPWSARTSVLSIVRPCWGHFNVPFSSCRNLEALSRVRSLAYARSTISGSFAGGPARFGVASASTRLVIKTGCSNRICVAATGLAMLLMHWYYSNAIRSVVHNATGRQNVVPHRNSPAAVLTSG